jgi:c(7)-type cytochrome triheme protein
MRLAILITLLVTIAFLGSAMAVGPGKTVEYESSMGKVTFTGKTHADAGGKCMDCHPKMFQMKQGTFKMSVPHKVGENCGECHDGEKAFSQVGADSCKKCHVK